MDSIWVALFALLLGACIALIHANSRKNRRR